MKIRRMAVTFIYKIACAIGSTMVIVGIILCAWFFFISDHEYRFYWGGCSILLIIIGYLIYRYAFPHIYQKWDDYY